MEVGDTLVTLYSDSSDRVMNAEPVIRQAYQITDEKPQERPLIYKRL